MLNKKYIIISGANGYLSQFFSKNLCKKYNLILWDIKFNKEFLLDIKKLAKENNSHIVFMNVDITNHLKIKRSIKILNSKKIKIYGLINCAGLNPQPNIQNPDYFRNYKSFMNMWEKEINISLKGYMSMIYEVSKILQKSKNSTIINFSSDLGIISPNQNIYSKDSIKPLVYSVSKHGIIGLTKYIATLWAKNKIRCNSIAPGGIYNGQNNNFVKKVRKLIPLGRMAKKDEYNDLMIFLCSDKSSYITGSTIVADGGRTIW